MEIIAKQHNDCIICRLADGKEIEITIVSVRAEDLIEETDVHEAVRLVVAGFHFFGSKPGI